MKINLKFPAKYKKPIRIAVWLITIFSIVEAFLSFPPMLSGIIAILLTGLLYVVERIIFVQNILWVYPFEERLFNRLGVAWFKQFDKNDQIVIGLGTIAKSKTDAKKIYQLYKNWCYGKYSGDDENIKISFVLEGESKYTMFVYPGKRKSKEDELKHEVKQELEEKNVEYNVSSSVFQYFYNCNEYGTRPEIKEAMEIIKKTNKVIINACFIKNNKLESYAKRGILIENIEFLDRQKISPKRLEHNFQWSDPNETSKEILSELEKIKI